MFKKKKKDREISVECWSLDYYLVLWLNKHLKRYLEDANTTVDLEYHKYKFKGKEISLKDAVCMLIELTNQLLETIYDWSGDFAPNEQDYKNINATKDEMYDLLKLVHWQLWW